MKFDKKKMSDTEKKSKLTALSGINKMVSDMMKDGLSSKGMKKVTVAADSKEGLKKGLQLAEDKLEGDESDESEDEECEDMDELESDSEEHDEFDDMDEEELDKKIKELMAIKEKLK